jgi:putative hydrolase
MLEVDLHVHTMFSHCGLHTVLEILKHAEKIGLKGVAITDHGLTLGGRLNSVFYERFQCPYPSVTLFKGIECNIVDGSGTVDMSSELLPFMDIVLLGIHHNIAKGLGKKVYTEMLVKAVEMNQFVDIISHPNDPSFPVDYRELAAAAKKKGIALEINNSKLIYARTDSDSFEELLLACKEVECGIVINSDTHAIHELGMNELVLPLLEKVNFPEKLIVNRTLETTNEFVKQRKILKTSIKGI